jgi:hypothetical protein
METDTYTAEYFEQRTLLMSAGVRKIRFRIQKFAQYRGVIASDSLALVGPYGGRWEELMETCDVFAMQYLKPLGEVEKSLEELKRCYRIVERDTGEGSADMKQLINEHFDTLTALQEQVLHELDERLVHVQETMRTLKQIREIDGGF